MPVELANALRFQADPNYQGKDFAYANLVCLAVRLLRNRGIGEGPQEPIPQGLFERLEIRPDKAEEAVTRVLNAEAALRALAQQFPH
jgi:HD-like signal output (HDOD) protein